MPTVVVRPEAPADAEAVARVHERAFERPDEARLVAALAARGAGLVSLVATVGGQVVGHVLFTAVTIGDGAGSGTPAIALAPLAVLPEHQRIGIGKALVRAGLEACRARGETLVFVLGHPDYYPRLGFRPAPPAGLRFRDASFDAAFFVAELVAGTLADCRGWVRYAPEFNAV